MANLRSMHPFVHLSIVFWLYTALQCRGSKWSKSLVFRTTWGIHQARLLLYFSFFLDLMKPNKVETAVQWFRMSCTVLAGFSGHHHHIALVARISLTLSRHSSLSFIALGRSSGQHPVSSHSCWMYVRAGRPAFARPCVGIHKSTSLMSSSLLLQQCPACLVLLTWIVFVIGGRWPYNWCLVGCCCQDLFRIARSILV